MRHGWFKIPGVQEGDRTVDEQLLGLDAALAACKGKTVLDLGAAEGLISAAFARAGAAEVFGVELVKEHVETGRAVCVGLPVKLLQAELAAYARDNLANPRKFDIVLALGIAHKMHNPGAFLSFAGRSAGELLVFRGPGKAGMFWDGILRSKFGKGQCNVAEVLGAEGLVEGETHDSARGERAQYWHRRG